MARAKTMTTRRARARRAAPTRPRRAAAKCQHRNHLFATRAGGVLVSADGAETTVCAGCKAVGVAALGPANDPAVDVRAAEIAQDVTALGDKALKPYAPRGFTGPLTTHNERVDGWIMHDAGLAAGDPVFDEEASPEAQSGWLARQIYPAHEPHDAEHVGLDGWTRALIARVCRDHAVEIHCTQEGCAAMAIGPLPAEWFGDAETGDVLCPQHKWRAVAVEVGAGADPEVGVELEVSTDPDDANEDLDTPPPEMLDGIDQSAPEPAAEVKLAGHRDGPIGDETLDLGKVEL